MRLLVFKSSQTVSRLNFSHFLGQKPASSYQGTSEMIEGTVYARNGKKLEKNENWIFMF